MPAIGVTPSPVKKHVSPRRQVSTKALISVAFVGYLSPFNLNYNQAPQLLLESLKRYLDSLGPVCLWTIYESVVITSTIDVLLKAGLATLLEADELS